MNIKIVCHATNCLNKEIVFVFNELTDLYACGGCGQKITDVIIEE